MIMMDECRYAECHYAECCYAECRYAECLGAAYCDWHVKMFVKLTTGLNVIKVFTAVIYEFL
jgi:hypothetical protein